MESTSPAIETSWFVSQNLSSRGKQSATRFKLLNIGSIARQSSQSSIALGVLVDIFNLALFSIATPNR